MSDSASGSLSHIRPVSLQPDFLLMFPLPYPHDFLSERSLHGTTSPVCPVGFFHNNLQFADPFFSRHLSLNRIVKQHGIEWEQKGTHEEHLDVYNFKKKERKKEVQEKPQGR